MLKLDYKTFIACLLLVTRVHAQQNPAAPSPAPAPVPSPSVSPAAVPEPAAPSPPPAASTAVEPPDSAPSPPGAAAAAPATEPAPAPPADDAPPPEDLMLEAEGEKWPELRFKARIMTGFELQTYHPEDGQTVPDTTEAGYFLEQAVIEVEAKLSKRLEFELGFNVRTVEVRDAFVNYRFDDAVEVRAGRFKRPFSRLELRSRGRIPFRDRGELNDELTDANLAGRTLGAMVHGQPVESLGYSFAVMSPAALGSDIEGADVIGRVVFEPSPAFSLGLAAQHKWSEYRADGPNMDLNAAGLDTKIEAGALEVTLEAEVFQNPNPPPVSTDTSVRTPWAFGAIGYATYRLPLSKKWNLEPVVVLEWLDPDLEYSGDDRLRAIAGLSVNFRKNLLRLMPQIEIERPTSGAGPRGEIASETYYLMVSSDL